MLPVRPGQVEPLLERSGKGGGRGQRVEGRPRSACWLSQMRRDVCIAACPCIYVGISFAVCSRLRVVEENISEVWEGFLVSDAMYLNHA